jgi:hypothetical protein
MTAQARLGAGVLLAAAISALLAAACNSAMPGGSAPAGDPDAAGALGPDAGAKPSSDASGDEPDSEPAGEPLTGLASGAWNWVDFPDSACDDGSPTGIAVNPGTSGDLVIFLNGGGACWDYLTCCVLEIATRGPFGAAQFDGLRSGALAGSILDRSLPGNPLRDATLVFVPYCTGDLHAGENVITYEGNGVERIFRHVGRANVRAYLRRIAATWPAPARLVVSGASGGGYGAFLDYDQIRSRFPESQAFLIDDSGPPLGPGAAPTAILEAGVAHWGLDSLLDPLCGEPCHESFATALRVLARKYPADRLAFLSSLRDKIISNYYLLDGARFEQELLRTSAEVLAPLPNVQFFFIPGDNHVMLTKPANFSQGIPLLQWLSQQLSGDAGWASQKPQ